MGLSVTGLSPQTDGWTLCDSSDQGEDFFRLLPPDWQAELAPHWNTLAQSTKVMTVQREGQIGGGGLVFSTLSPDVQSYPQIAEAYLNAGFRYIAYLWICPDCRKLGLGSFWLQSLFERYPQHRWWLTIDEPSLAGFYQKNGFVIDRTISMATGDEVVLVRAAIQGAI